MKLLVLFLTIEFYVLLVSSKSALELNFQHLRKITDDSELGSLRQKNEVSAVYYYKREIPRLRGFLKELDKTAEYLKLYGVEIGLFDCGNEAKEPKCNENNVEFNIYTYRSGHMMLELGLETMFDVNSIMSNMLQLVLIHDVPILQSVEERREFEDKYKGKKDILFTYQKAIGTFEHRIFMEVAFAYQDKFKFAVCTNKQAIQDLKDSPYDPVDRSIWVLRCKDFTLKGYKCPHVQFNRKYDLATLANFVKTLTYPLVHMMPKHGRDIPFYNDKGMPVGFFFHDKSSEDEIMTAAKSTAEAFYTLVGIVAVDMDKMSETEKEEIGFKGKLPAFAFHTKEMDRPIYMKKSWSLEEIHKFLIDMLNKQEVLDHPDAVGNHGDIMTPHPVEEGEEVFHDEEQFSEEDIEAVETQDDEVAEAVHQSRVRGRSPKVDLIDALTDQTFPTTVKNKDLVFVLFYLPFDDKSMAFLYSYADASKEIESDPSRPLTRVNCHDWTDVCGKEKIISYPTVRIYRNGKMWKDYKGMLDSRAMVTTVKLLNQSNPVMLDDSSSVMDLMNGVLPGGQQIASETVVMALLDKKYKKELKVFSEVVKQLEDSITFAVNDNGDASKIPNFQYKVPSIVVIRRSDILKPTVVYNGKMAVDDLKQFILKASIPSMPELTVDWFPMLYRQETPLVILFLDSYQESARVKKVMEDVVLTGKFSKLQFVWMMAETGTIGRTVLTGYDKDSIVPAIACVNLKNGSVYVSKDEYPTVESVSSWLQGITGDKTKPSKVLEQGDWKPKKKGYDFLRLIDKEREKKKRKRENQLERNVLDEQGIGFDHQGREIDLEGERRKFEAGQNPDNPEDEIREELMALHNTRLYKAGGGRKHKEHADEVISPHSKSRKEEEKSSVHQSKHTEL